LIAACRKGQLSLVKRLIENGAKPDLTNSKNQHPFEFLLSSRQENYDVADYLITQMQSVFIF
jgi:ankyrin repeat protein